MNDKILRNMYIEQHMTMQKVADILGVSRYTIRKHLNENNIPIRKKGFGYNVRPEIHITDEQMEFFDGLMASDGSICRRNSIKGRKTRGNDFLSCGFKHGEFAEYIVNTLGLECKVKPYTHFSSRYKNGSCDQFKFISENNIFFTKERDRWYPSGIKRIPSDFRFSPVSMNILYLGDGWIRKDDGRIFISTDSFDIDNIHILTNKLNDIKIPNTINSRHQICIKDSAKFLEFIGDCPVECYNYKWIMKERKDK